MRDEGSQSFEGDVVGRWALAEMLEPGGDPALAARARARLNERSVSKQGVYYNLARAISDEVHGNPRSAADAYVSTLQATAAALADPAAPLVGWFASHHLVGLRGAVTDLYVQHKEALLALVASPGNLGWRAVAEILEWSAAEAFDRAEATGDAYDALVTGRLGCAKAMHIAGPFGRGAAPDRRRTFAAENPGPWPPSWPEDPTRGTVPHILRVEQHRCFASSTENTEDGIFYVQTFFTTKDERDLIVAVQGAVAVWLDDTIVLERDLRQWGSWQNFGVTVRVGIGRHRILARVISDGSSVRLLETDGRPAGVDTDGDDRFGYSIAPPRVIGNPNIIDAVVRGRALSKEPHSASALDEALAASLAHIEGMDDVATVLIEPLVAEKNASPVALEEAATFVKGDPALPEDVRARTEKGLRARALARDPKLWRSRVWLIVDDAEQRGMLEGVAPMRKLADEVPEEPEVLESLARLYGQLEWRGEHMQALTALAQRFPDDVNSLRLYLDALDQDGALTAADAVAARIRRLDPDSEVDLDRALARHDWKGAVAELQRLGKRRPDRKEIAGRIADVLERAGDPSAAAAELSQALAKTPLDATARFRLADRAYAKGESTALRKALADALQVGAKVDDLRGAIDLIEGATDLEPYRQDGRSIIRAFEAWEKTGRHMEGSAARVLDYAATWVHPDGSSEMLEHEILRVQSQEAIGEEAEQAPPAGLVLRLRVIKADGSVLEPEAVAGKPSVSMPHLEVGDYIEMEHIAPSPGDGPRGKRFRGPHWFFREADKGYWRSEFVTITPRDRDLEIETRGNVPEPQVRTFGTFVERRWRVDLSPPALEEPESPPITEFLPSVRVGWGISLEDAVDRLVDAASDETPLDPRLRVRALEIVGRVPEDQPDERARLVYKDIVAHVDDGRETDGRRVILGKSGSRQAAFQYMMRQLGIPVEVAIVKNKLATPPLGKMSEVESYDSLVVRLETGNGQIRWLTVHDKFAPYGYLPAELRQQPAIVLARGTPREVTSANGAIDAITFEGRANLRADGSASVDLVESFLGKVAISMRSVLDKVPEAQIHDFVEQRLLGRNLPGARVRDLRIENREELGAPIVMHIAAEVPQLGRQEEHGIVLSPIFAVHLAQLATLPERQTPLLLGASSHVEVRFEVVVPASMHVPASLPHAEARERDRLVTIKDTVHGNELRLDRVVDMPAGRIQPGTEYADFRRFVQEADTLLEREVFIGGR
jgi:tetratricopeptide (TPR) repeat protein